MKSYPLFVVVGGIGSVFILLMTYIMTDILGLWYLFSYIVSTISGWTLVFVLNRKFTFKIFINERQSTQYFKFIVIYGFMGLINFSLVFFLTSIINIYYLLSIVLVVVPISLINFFISFA